MSVGKADKTVTVDKTASYTLNANVPSGFEFYRWTKNAAGDELANSATYTGTLPEGAVINAMFAKTGSACYQVNGKDYCYFEPTSLAL